MDLATAGQAEEFIRLSRRPGDEVVLDLTGIPFMDCSGLTMLWRLHQDAGCDGGAVRLAALQREPARVLRLTGAERRLPIHRTLSPTRSPPPPQPRAGFVDGPAGPAGLPPPADW
ncbi:STAS domain-containing protein [Nonomuraea sp. NPDC050451]|uniref:STAS domain-containing protein n=1 Tax=Nonomuraea sp. NPDC050451 TaxID=3364364 RepID=UPI00379BA0CF